MKRVLVALLVIVLALSLMVAGCAKQEEAADNSADNAAAADDAGADDTVAANADAAEDGDEVFDIVLIAKTEGLAWFDDMRVGVNEFNDTHDDANVSQIAPEGADPAKQIAMFEDAISRGVDAICVVPCDPMSLVPVITKAKEQGIIVISHEAQSIAGTVDWDMEAFSNEDFGALYGQKLGEAMGGQGKYCGCVGALTMETHMQWYNAAVDYITENYPDMELVADKPFEDHIDSQVGYDLAKEVLKAYPDIGGYLGMTVEGGSSMCLVLKENNNTNVKVSCLALPSVFGDYIKEGWCTHGQCWRPADAGYTTVNIAYKMLKGEEIADGVDLEKEGYADCKVVDGVIYANAPLVLTAENVDSLPF